jgi:hypothetical protein
MNRCVAVAPILRHVPIALALLWSVRPPVAHAAPCVVPEVAVARLQQTLERLSARPLVPSVEPAWWRVLVPRHVGAVVRQGQLAGDDWYMGLNGPTQRTVNHGDQALTLRLEWDLSPLWTMPVAPRPSPTEELQRALHAEELARRLSTQLQRIRKAQAVALQAQAGDYVCADARAEAEAAAVVLTAIGNLR